jgi:hypothetical protein
VRVEPSVKVEEVILLRPQHARQRLSLDATLVVGQRFGADSVIELIGFLLIRSYSGRALGLSGGACISRRDAVSPPAAAFPPTAVHPCSVPSVQRSWASAQSRMSWGRT